MTRKKYTVYYGTQLYGSYNTRGEIQEAISVTDDVYHGGYVYLLGVVADVGWYRLDLTPVLDADVPKELKLLHLLLGEP